VSDGVFFEIHAGQRLMRSTGVIGFASVLSMSGCAGLGTLPPDAASSSRPRQAETEAVAPAVAPPALPGAQPGTVATRTGIAAVESTHGSATPPVAASPRIAPPAAAVPSKPRVPPVSAALPSRKDDIPPASASSKAPPLDLASLQRRLKETGAIGVFTKITLKNQVDDLLDRFRAFYQGKLKTDLADLRRSYDLLVLKVLSLLQDSDQALATAIVASREAIWGILSDPAKFAKI
jgi:hypothetical protein